MFKVHPAMVYVSEGRRMKSPPALARVLLLVAITVPPCGHIMTLEVLSRFPIVDLRIARSNGRAARGNFVATGFSFPIGASFFQPGSRMPFEII